MLPCLSQHLLKDCSCTLYVFTNLYMYIHVLARPETIDVRDLSVYGVYICYAYTGVSLALISSEKLS